jgi:hypothetical protein
MLEHNREWPVKDRNGRVKELKDVPTDDLENGIRSFGRSFQRMYFTTCVFFVAIWSRTGIRMLMDGKMLEIESLDTLNVAEIRKYPAKYKKNTWTAISNLTSRELEDELRRLWNEVLPGFTHQIDLYRAELTFRGETNHPREFWNSSTEEWLKQKVEWAEDQFFQEYNNQ